METVVQQMTDDYYTCPICMEHFNTPKTLPCLHTYCEECLRDYVETRGYVAVGKFMCSICRAETIIPPAGISALPTNFTLQNMLDQLKKAASVQPESREINSPPPPYNTQPPQQVPSYQASTTYMYPQLPAATVPQQANIHVPQPMTTGPSPQDQTPLFYPASNLPPYPVSNAPAAMPVPSFPYGQAPVQPQHSGVTADSYPQPNVPTCEPLQQNQPALQRKLNLAAEDFTVPVKIGVNGAKVCFGCFGTGLTDFTNPIGLTCADDKYLLLSDQRSNRIMIFTPTGFIKTMFTCQGVVQDICMAPDGNLVVANTKAQRALAKSYTLSGQQKMSYGAQFTYETPHGVAVSDRHVAVSTTETNKVYILGAVDGRMLKEFGGTGSREKQFRSPFYLAMTSDNDVIVSDTGNNAIKVFNINAQFKFTIGGPGTKSAKQGQLNRPMGIAVDSEDSIYVVDSNNHRVQRFSNKGKFLNVVIENIYGPGPEVVPTNIALIGNDEVAVLVTGARFAEVRVYALSKSKVCVCQ